MNVGRMVVRVLLALAASSAAVAGVAAQVAMPDAAQMSGVPLPAPELPDAAITVRVVRERMGNNLPGQEVALETPDGRVTGVTDAEGRAQFMAVSAGASVTAEVTVDGETVRSQPFTVPARGGVRVALVVGVARAAAADAAAREAAAREPARPGSVVFGADTRVILEFQDDRPTIFYLFSLVNNARTPVDTGRPLVLDLPPDAESASLVSGPAAIARMEDRRLTLTGPFPPGATAFQIAYRLPLTERFTIHQAWPAAVEGVLVAAEKAGGLTMTSAQLAASREGESNGEVFVMGTAGRLAEGQALTLDFRGVPAPPTWPRTVAIATASALALWALWAIWRGGPDPVAARAALVQERERLLGAIAAIDAERRARGGDDPRAAAKRERLVAAAEAVYAELDRLPGGTAA
ncbi:MAG: hypothetical protein AB7U83_09425 [Vicinamibacterales bacterium]